MDDWLNLLDLYVARIDDQGNIVERSRAWSEELAAADSVADVITHPRWQKWPAGATRITATAADGTSLALLGIRQGDLLIAHQDRQEVISAGKMGQLAQELDDLRRQANSQADEIQRANDDLRTLAHGLSHDVGAKIRRAQESMGQNSEAARYLDQAIAIVQELTRYGDAGSVELNVTTFPLQELLDEVMIGTDAAVESDVGDITGDRDLLTKLFHNLIENSDKYAVPAAVKIHQRGNEITIQDNGPGVTQQQADTMFDLFQRHSKKPGTGIGLALCRKIMQKHGGTIGVEAGPGCKITLRFAQGTE